MTGAPITASNLPEVRERSGTGNPGKEGMLIVGCLILFVLLNALTADKAPAVWCDEVMYEDPAVNLYQGHGFTSGAWFAQGMDKFWAGNVPLYQGVLFVWLKLFGFSLGSVRSFHYVLVGTAVFITWLAVRRLNLITTAAHRIAFCAVLCFCDSSSFVYRSARPESLAFVFVAVALLAFSFKSRPLILIVLGVCGLLLTWCGLQLAAYAAFFCGVALLCGFKRYLPEFIVLGCGCAMGGCLLYVFYAHFGVWNDFVNSISHFTIANQRTNYGFIRSTGQGIAAKLKQGAAVFVDYTFVPLFLAAMMMFLSPRQTGKRVTPAFRLGLAVSLAIPFCMGIIGVFPIYYRWMAVLPLALAVCVELLPWLEKNPGILLRAAFASLLVLACLSGLPRRLLTASFQWEARSYGPVMKLAAPYAGNDRVIYSEFASYYAARQNGARVVLPPCLHLLSDQEKKQISVAIVHTQNPQEVAAQLGGAWQDTGKRMNPLSGKMFRGLHERLDAGEYNLGVFLREQ